MALTFSVASVTGKTYDVMVKGEDSWQQGIRLSGAQKEILGLTTKRKVCGGKKILFCLGYFKDRNGAI